MIILALMNQIPHVDALNLLMCAIDSNNTNKQKQNRCPYMVVQRPVFLKAWTRNGVVISDKYMAVISDKCEAVFFNKYHYFSQQNINKQKNYLWTLWMGVIIHGKNGFKNTFYVIKITLTFDPIIYFLCPLILTIYKKKVVIPSILWRRKTETWTFWAWSPKIAKGQTHI